MRIVTIGFKILRIRWGCAAMAAGLMVLFSYGPSWSHGIRRDHQTISILAQEPIGASFAGYEFLSKKSKKWKDLSPEEKKQLRKRYKEWQSLPPEEKEKIREEIDTQVGKRDITKKNDCKNNHDDCDWIVD